MTQTSDKSCFSMLLILVFIFSAIASCIVVRGPNGTHPVAYTVEALTDEARWDPLAPAEEPQKRRIVVSTFSPLDDINGESQPGEPIPYLPHATATTYKVILESLELPNYLFDGFELQFHHSKSQHVNSSSSEYPVIIFSPGFATSRLLSSTQAQSLASHGFTVITIDHPYDATVVEFPSGEVVYGYNISDFSDDLAETLVEVRRADVSFLINQLPYLLGPSFNSYKQPNIFVYGQSLGGSTAALAASGDSRVLGGLDFDGSLYGTVNETGMDKPFVLAGRPVPPDVPIAAWYDGFYDRLRGEKMFVTVNGTDHLSFCDAPLLVALRDDVTNEQRPVLDAVLGTIDGKELAGILDGLLFSTAQLLFDGDPTELCTIGHINEGLLVLEEELPCSS